MSFPDDITIDPFPSAFKDSPLGESWDLEFARVPTDHIMTGVESKKTTVNIMPTAILRYKSSELKEAYSNRPPQYSNAYTSYIELESGSNVVVKYLVTDNPFVGCKFSSKSIKNIYGVKLGTAIVNSFPSKEIIRLYTDEYLEWLLIGDSESTREGKAKEFVEKAMIYLAQQPTHRQYNFIMNLLIQLKSKLLGALTHILEDFFQYIGDELRKFKITDPNTWRPFLENGQINPKYNPVFLPSKRKLVSDILKLFEASAKVLDSKIANVLKKFNSSDISDEKSKLNLIQVIQFFYDAIKKVLYELYKGFKIIVEGFFSSIEHLNAFLIGINNGLVDLFAGIIDLIGVILNDDKIKEFITNIAKIFERIKNEKLDTLLNEIITLFIKKYKDAKSSYDILKNLGEDLAEIILSIIIALLSGGATAIVTLRVLVKELKELLEKPPSLDTLREIRNKLKKKADREESDKYSENVEKTGNGKREFDIKAWAAYSYKDLFATPPKKPCFLAGTEIHIESGLIFIESIKVGQSVFSYNSATEQVELKKVVSVHSNWTDKYLVIHSSDQSDTCVSGRHMIWEREQNKWMMANQLTKGMKLHSRNISGDDLIITEIEVIEKKASTYNFEVEDNHNYFVGKTGFLVHNQSKVSIFESMTTILVDLYEIIDESGKVLYVGQTVQGIEKRFEQHLYDKKKTWLKKNFKRQSIGNIGPRNMTPFEAHVNELYEINKNGGLVGNKGTLKNKKRPISENKFDAFKKFHNPCKFY